MSKDEEIIKGWERITEEYTPGELTVYERHQLERMALIERQNKETPFILGELINPPTKQS